MKNNSGRSYGGSKIVHNLVTEAFENPIQICKQVCLDNIKPVFHLHAGCEPPYFSNQYSIYTQDVNLHIFNFKLSNSMHSSDHATTSYVIVHKYYNLQALQHQT